MEVYQALTLMISFATLVVLILSFHNKKKTARDKVMVYFLLDSPL